MINPDESRTTGLYTGPRAGSREAPKRLVDHSQLLPGAAEKMKRRRCPTCGQVIGGGKPLPEGGFKPKPGIGQSPVMGDRPPPNSPLKYTAVVPPTGMKYVYNQQTGERSTVPISGGRPGFPKPKPGFPRPKPGFPGQRPGFPGGGRPVPGFPGQRPGRPLPGRPNPYLRKKPWDKKLTNELYDRQRREGGTRRKMY